MHLLCKVFTLTNSCTPPYITQWFDPDVRMCVCVCESKSERENMNVCARVAQLWHLGQLCYITFPLSKPWTGWYPGQVVSNHILFTMLMAYFKMIKAAGLYHNTGAMISHSLDPGQCSMVSFKVKLLSKEVILQAVKGPFDGEALFLYCWISGFPGQQLATEVDDRFFFSFTSLWQHCPKSCRGSIHLHQELLQEIWAL